MTSRPRTKKAASLSELGQGKEVGFFDVCESLRKFLLLLKPNFRCIPYCVENACDIKTCALLKKQRCWCQRQDLI